MTTAERHLLHYRAPHVLHALPPKYRWEFTRRHPSYVECANMFRAVTAANGNDPHINEILGVIRAKLLLLGVTADPPPPGITFEELNSQPDVSRNWIDGAIAPVTTRGLAMPLLGLPDGAKQAIIDALQLSMGGGDRVYNAILALQQSKHPVLDDHSSAGVIGVNYYAPTKAIVAAIEQLARDEKDRLSIPETRRRYETLDDKLAVWDLREGWAGDHYEVDRELGYEQIAMRLGSNTSTLAHRYAEAFYYVTGHQYSFSSWFITFENAKLLGLAWKACLGRRRNRQTGGSLIKVEQVSPPEPPAHAESLETTMTDASEAFELLEDIRTLILQRDDDATIVKKLGLKHIRLVTYIRSHL